MKKILCIFMLALFSYIWADSIRFTKDADVLDSNGNVITTFAKGKILSIYYYRPASEGCPVKSDIDFSDVPGWFFIHTYAGIGYVRENDAEWYIPGSKNAFKVNFKEHIVIFSITILLIIIIFVLIFMLIRESFLSFLLGLVAGGFVSFYCISLPGLADLIVTIFKYLPYLPGAFAIIWLNNKLVEKFGISLLSGGKSSSTNNQNSKKQFNNINKTQAYYCVYCGYKTNSIHDLTLYTCSKNPNGKYHVPYEGDEKNQYCCSYCGYKADSIHGLTLYTCSKNPNGKYHVPYEGDEKNQYCCSYCGYKADSIHDLTLYICSKNPNGKYHFPAR